MACQVPPIAQLTNNQTFINVSQLAQSAAADIAYQLGIALTVGDTIIPLAPFIWAAIAIEEIIGLFGSGRPKFEDTESVIAAYKQSTYWPLHTLAADMQIWVKNGAPISDSNPAVQATFSAAKQGTIESIQQLAGLSPGPQSPGYWQLQELINTSWVYSKGGEQAVLQVVKAIDCFTEVLTQIATKPPPPPPPPPPPSPPPDGGGGGNGDLIQELIACLCDETSDECCTAVVAAIAKVAQQLAVIASALTFGGKGGGGGGPSIDLSGILAAIEQLVAAVAAIQSLPAPDLTALVTAVDNVASAVKNPDPCVCDALTGNTATAKGIQTKWLLMVQRDVAAGLIDAQDAQIVTS